MNRTSILAAAVAAGLALAAPMNAAADDAGAAYEDIEETYGAVPGLFRLFARDDIAAAWEAFTDLQMNPELGLDARLRELIGVAVAIGSDCRQCVYFHAAAAVANGASEADVRGAATIGMLTHRLDAALARTVADPAGFKREVDLVLWGDPGTVKARAPSHDFGDLVAGGGSCD
jgi:AhpD family alkylhydroperoxidase